jgi:hypothetical protein
MSVAPNFANPQGGAVIGIQGSGFQQGAAVRFGSAPGTNVRVFGDTVINATVPPGSGIVDVTVTNPDGQSATVPQGLHYLVQVSSITATPPVVALFGPSQLAVSGIGGFPPYTFQWSTADPLSNATIANPVATPNRTAIYTCTITDSEGFRSSGSVTITIFNTTLETFARTLQPDNPVVHNIPVTFDGSLSFGPNPIVNFEWWFNWNPAQPTAPDLSGPFVISPTFTYSAAGAVTVRLRVTDSTGATATATLGFPVQ